ncbi:MAG: Re/Si-specific NAD(P)(+) transhydrogenase subunit alpha [Microcoleaceae cyanobacterium]
MKIAIAKEIQVDERRVALTPEVAARLVKQGVEIWAEAGAGERAYFSDEAYVGNGVQISTDSNWLWHEADVVVKVGALQASEVEKLRQGSVLIGFLDPLGNPALIQQLAERQVTAFSMEMVPRISRAQSMDALSSQANIGGYKAVLIAAAALPKYFPMLTTAAGTIRPAKVLVMGAGVAGLQAIATARRLGAVVEAYDIRPEVKEQVQSLGAKFVDITLNEDTVAEGGYAKEISQNAQEYARKVLTEHVAASDVVITTAQIPGRKAPVLVTEDMLSQMKPGSVVVDLAASQGGNCEGTEAGKDIQKHGVTIIGPTNLPSSMPLHASEVYAKNILALLKLMTTENGELNLDFEDQVISSACLTLNGEIRSERVQKALEQLQSAVNN